MVYLRLANGGIVSITIPFILIGEGESGKTSLIKAMESGSSPKISEDKRTVGIDMSTIDWTDMDDGFELHVKDMAGQAIYGISNQLWLVPRAVYLLVWRIKSGLASLDDELAGLRLRAHGTGRGQLAQLARQLADPPRLLLLRRADEQ